MNARSILGVAFVVAAAVVAACGDDPSSLGAGGKDPGGAATAGPGGSNGGGGGDGALPSGGGDQTGTNSPAAKTFYISNVHPFLATNCAGCHDKTGPGPNWIIASDPSTTYGMLFQLGYVATDSRIMLKGAHEGSATNFLTDPQKATYLSWVQMELAAGGTKTTTNVLGAVANCVDQTKFDAIGLGNLRTIQRTNNNNTNKVTTWAENADRCTGCDNAPCKDCHSADPASNFVNAIGNNGLPVDYTFQQTKLTNPAYLQHYFGVDPTGAPIASHAIENKSAATSKDVAYTHPYFTLTTAQVTAIQAFVDDAVAKYAAGTCPAATP